MLSAAKHLTDVADGAGEILRCAQDDIESFMPMLEYRGRMKAETVDNHFAMLSAAKHLTDVADGMGEILRYAQDDKGSGMPVIDHQCREGTGGR